MICRSSTTNVRSVFIVVVSIIITNNYVHAFASTHPTTPPKCGVTCSTSTTLSAVSSPFSNLSVSELKRLLTERDVDFRDCLEKTDLIDRLLQSQPNRRSGTTTTSSSKFTPAERQIMETFKSVAPSVAYITTTPLPGRSGFMSSLSLQGDDGQQPSGGGSGFLWDDQGHVVTNCHVVTAGTDRVPSSVRVKLQGLPEAYDAPVVGIDAETDLAVVKIPAFSSSSGRQSSSNLPSPIAAVGTSDDLQVGQSVLAIGNPFGLDNTLTTGVVSALGRDVNGFGGRIIKNCVQTDAAINPGNSGGCLLDSGGRLIGVNTAIYTPSGGGSVGIGFAIPVDTVRRVVNKLIRYGRVRRPSLGVHMANDRQVRSIELQQQRPLNGVLVADVVPGSPADRAGLKPTRRRFDGSILLGDVITAVDTTPVRQTDDLLSAIELKEAGDVVVLSVQRGDGQRLQKISMTLVERSSTSPKKRSQHTSAAWQ